MNSGQMTLERFDKWLRDDSEVAALVMRQWLEPVEGKDGVIFPPTYTLDATDVGDRFKKGEPVPGVYKGQDGPVGYNLDILDDGTTVCLIDSVGSQANRMEPIFKRENLKAIFEREGLQYCDLVPQVQIRVRTRGGDRLVHLLDAGHRAADAIVRFADKMEGDPHGKGLAERVWEAFLAWQDFGDAELLARIAPTSLVFGVWDSRATQAKVPRLVRSVIRAYRVKPLHRSAQFNPPLHYVNEGVIDEALNKGQEQRNPLSQEGFRDNPAPWAHGGVEVAGEIRREVTLNLVALRSLGVRQNLDETEEETKQRLLTLRRYLLGLALVAIMHRGERMFNLREGCLLRIARSSSWKAVPFEGEPKEVSLDFKVALAFTQSAAKSFGVENFDKPFVFDNEKAMRWLKLDKDDRDSRRRQGPVLKQEL
jgi:CRISPR-associated protein Csb1